MTQYPLCAELPVSEPTTKPGVYAETLPVVTCDIALGQLVADIGVDASYFADLMRSHGSDDEAIMGTTIHMSSKTILEPAGGEEGVVFGDHDPVTNTIKMYIGSVIHIAKLASKLNLDKQGVDEWEDAEINEKVSETTSIYAAHEVSHRIDDIVMGRDAVLEEEQQYYSQIVPNGFIAKLRRGIAWALNDVNTVKRLDIKRDVKVLEAMLDPEFDAYRQQPKELRAKKMEETAETAFAEGSQHPIRITHCDPAIR